VGVDSVLSRFSCEVWEESEEASEHVLDLSRAAGDGNMGWVNVA